MQNAGREKQMKSALNTFLSLYKALVVHAFARLFTEVVYLHSFINLLYVQIFLLCLAHKSHTNGDGLARFIFSEIDKQFDKGKIFMTLVDVKGMLTGVRRYYSTRIH